MRPFLSRHRRLLLSLCTALILVVAGAAYALKDPAPVGYFTSAAAQDRFFRAYDEAMRAMPAPDRTLDLRTSYGIVRVYHFTGAEPGRPPLLLLPGRASATPVWADNLPSLLQVRSVYAVDLLGEPGRSVQSRPIAGPADHAQWLHEVLTQLPEPQLHLLGLSFGGWTAANLVVHRPAKVAGVVLLDPVLVFSDLSAEVVLRSIPAGIRWFPKSWRDSFASWTANDAPVEDEPVAQMIEAGMQSYAMKLSTPARPTDEQLAAVRTPALVLLAGDSRMHDANAAAETARRTLPGADVHVYPGASHAINGEFPDRIATDVGAFVGRTSAGAN
jgi:pimeloyl-ACP methyl ester carboxylesterase